MPKPQSKSDSESPNPGSKSKSASGPPRDARRRVRLALEALRRLYPEAVCALDHANPFELLAATILSAQCTDARVNLVTPRLFERYPDPEALAAADSDELEAIVHPTGFFRNKAKNLVGMARALVERHQGRVPPDLDALTALPGVGRKTANVVMGAAFGVPSGVVVDTHVKRLSRRLGLTRASDPNIIEKDLIRILPREEWIAFSHRLILHGRAVCDARRPRCGACALREFCPKRGVEPRFHREIRTDNPDSEPETETAPPDAEPRS